MRSSARIGTCRRASSYILLFPCQYLPLLPFCHPDTLTTCQRLSCFRHMLRVVDRAGLVELRRYKHRELVACTR
jgi:hypothetical protein